MAVCHIPVGKIRRMLTGASPILATVDVAGTVRFYSEVLGFPSSWVWGDPPEFGAASWGKVRIMFSLNPEVAGRSDGQELWVDVDDVNALYASHLERGAMVVSDIEDKPWGRREYTVCDPNGYHLRFGGDPTHRPRGSGMLPSDIRIERRKPTAEEFHAVAGGAFNYGEASADLLASTWAGVLAEDSNGETIGVVRIMFDAPGWFSIWDVAVLPDWQGQRIGTAMMEAALEIVREVSPGANVYLFTFKHEFYERLGFARESVDLVKV